MDFGNARFVLGYAIHNLRVTTTSIGNNGHKSKKIRLFKLEEVLSALSWSLVFDDYTDNCTYVTIKDKCEKVQSSPTSHKQ